MYSTLTVCSEHADEAPLVEGSNANANANVGVVCCRPSDNSSASTLSYSGEDSLGFHDEDWLLENDEDDDDLDIFGRAECCCIVLMLCSLDH